MWKKELAPSEARKGRGNKTGRGAVNDAGGIEESAPRIAAVRQRPGGVAEGGSSGKPLAPSETAFPQPRPPWATATAPLDEEASSLSI